MEKHDKHSLADGAVATTASGALYVHIPKIHTLFRCEFNGANRYCASAVSGDVADARSMREISDVTGAAEVRSGVGAVWGGGGDGDG